MQELKNHFPALNKTGLKMWSDIVKRYGQHLSLCIMMHHILPCTVSSMCKQTDLPTPGNWKTSQVRSYNHVHTYMCVLTTHKATLLTVADQGQPSPGSWKTSQPCTVHVCANHTRLYPSLCMWRIKDLFPPPESWKTSQVATTMYVQCVC